MNRFDLSPLYGKNGKFESYRSDRPIGMGSRMGPQTMVVCGWALQALKERPGLWDEAVKKLAGKAVFVPFELEEGKPTTISMGENEVIFRVSREAISVGLPTDARTVLNLYAGPDAKGAHTAFFFPEPVVLSGQHDWDLTPLLTIKGSGRDTTYWASFLVAKRQKNWLNGIELGRYSIKVGNETKNFTTVSREADVKKALERELAGGLRTWMKVFADKGYIPTGIGAGKDWDGLSDTGGYAHLIKAGALYLMLLDGKTDYAR